MSQNQTILPHSITVALQTDKVLSAYAPFAASIEKYGFDGVTVYNDLLYQPPWLPLLEIARATRYLRIGVAAVIPFLCHPVNIAGNIALIDEASHGRAYLGMARGGWLDFVGVEPQKPVTALREAFACVRHLLQRSTEPLAGECFSLVGGDSLRWSLLRSEIPFLLGSWGIKTIQSCLPYVNEVKIGGTANPDLAPYYRKVLDDAIKSQSSADAPEKSLVFGAVTVVDMDAQAARKRARREVALYLPVIADLDPTLTIEPELMARLRAATALYDFETAGSLISDELLARFAFAGGPDDLIRQGQLLFEAGVNRIEFGTPHGFTTEEGLRLLGEKVLPGLRR